LQRQWKRSLAGLALLITLGQTLALAATINVGGTCTFVRAIVAANSNTTASGNCRKGSGADTIVLPRNSTIPRWDDPQQAVTVRLYFNNGSASSFPAWRPAWSAA
jgi:hypothetical protein